MTRFSRKDLDLSLNRRVLLERLIKEEGLEPPEEKRIPRRKDPACAPLSFAQQRLWFINELEPGNPVYTNHFAVRFIGAVNIAAVQQSINEIVRYHESLRTVFSTVQDRPLQVIAKTLKLRLPVADLTGLSADIREAEGQQLAIREARQPIDLERGPLLRTTLLLLGEFESLLLFSVHHIISDGWSLALFIKQMGAVYAAFCGGRESPLSELPIQFGDYAQWQQESLDEELIAAHLAYWKEKLADPQPALELPADHGRPPVQSFNGARQYFEISGQLTGELRAMSQQGVTLFMLLLAAFKALLYRYTGQREIVVGSPIAGRNRAELKDLFGCVANVLVLRTSLNGGLSFRDLVNRVKQTCLEAYEHQDIPFEKLVEALQPGRDLGRTPLFQVMLVLQSFPISNRMADVKLDLAEIDNGTSKFDLTLEVMEKPDGLSATLEYSTDLFESETVARMINHFQVLLAGIVADPSQSIWELALLTEGERREMVEEWNDTGVHYPRDMCIHQLIERQVVEKPDRAAVWAGNQSLSYEELNRRANRLAHYLIGRGVRPESLVPVCLPRTLDLVVGLLGVLKAGAAYVPIDPAYPPERLQFMLDDARATMLLTHSSLSDSFDSPSAVPIFLDLEAALISAQPDFEPAVAVSSGNLAYVIYTSGSTGKPKGVAIEHRSAVALIEWARTTFSPPELELVLASTSVCFDLSIFELFVTLSCGASVVLVENALALISDHHLLPVTLINTVPSAMTELVRQRAVPSSVQTINLAGEALSAKLAGDAYLQAPGARVINLYGPSEDTTYSTWEEVAKGAEDVAIGRPIANTRLYNLDGRLDPVPQGVIGELHIAGDGLARGYYNRPEQTAERFIAEGVGQQPGTRMYRTGDLCRYQSGGRVDYIGRADRQVKVRGYRIELGEIEEAIRQLPGVRAAAVVVTEDRAGGKGLAAYVEMDEGQPVEQWVRQSLREKLPEYMVPAQIVRMAALPLTPNGKIDRLALPKLELSLDAGGYAAPRNPAEEILADIWAGILGVEKVGINDNFFDIGGHSLLATQVASRVRETFAIDLELRSVFESPVLRDLATAIERKRSAGEGVEAPSISPVSREGDLPLSFAQQRLWFLEQLEPGSPLYNAPIVVKLTGQLNTNALVAALGEIISRHESLRTVFASAQGNPIQVVKPPSSITLKIVDLTRLTDEEKESHAITIARQEARAPFDLERGLLVRARLLRLSQSDHIAMLTMHHIVSDGWSVGVLVKELCALYEAYLTGGQSPLEELKIQYADYAVWQRDWLESGALQTQVDYWTRQLEGAPELFELPTDRPRPANRSYNGSQERFQFSKEIADGLNQLSKRNGATLFMTLLATFQTLLHRLSNQTDIVVGTDIANRHRAEIEGLIGFFGNQLVLRTDLSGNPTFRELLARVKEITLDGYAHQDMPFGKLVEVLNPDRRSGRTPLFQVKMVLQNAPAGALVLPGLTIEMVEDNNRIGLARFDLLLTFVEGEQGLLAVIEYSQDLFDGGMIVRMLGRLGKLIESILAQPDARLESLTVFSEGEIMEREIQKKERQQSSLERFKSIKPRSLDLSPHEFIKVSDPRGDETAPMIIEPTMDGINLSEWVGCNKSFVEERLLRHGAILFRGFNLASQAHFEDFLGSTASGMMNYMEGATPRTRLSETVYTSTEYPADQYIALHNELTYVTSWPMKIYFFCLRPAAEGGETPIADVRRVYDRIDPRIRDRFAERGWMLVRNFGQGLSLPWQTSFHTSGKAEAEAYFRAARIDWEWKADGGLRTRQVRPAVARHPRTGEMVWFNHLAFWHVSSLEPKVRDSMLTMFRQEDLPYNTYYGDGSAVEDTVVEQIREAYRRERREYRWQAGDLLMLDNMLAAHGRNPYSGPRRVLVAMSEASDPIAK